MQPIFLLETWVAGLEPAIRRRLEVPANLRLSDLHVILQIAFGWTNSHLHQFTAPGGKRFSDPAFELECEAEQEFTLQQVLPGLGEVLEYEYDFGDSWLHPVVLWGVSLPEPGAQYPRCTDGERSAPPEDCGGLPGYLELLELLAADPRRKKRAAFDPEAFSLDEVNRELNQYFKPRKPATKKKAAKKKV